MALRSKPDGYAKAFLQLLNGLMLLYALIIIIFASHFVAVFNTFDNKTVSTPPGLIVAFAVILFLGTIIGMIGVQIENRILIIVYLFLVFISWFIFIVCGPVSVARGNLYNKVSKGQVGSGGNREQIVDFQLALFTKCCADRFDLPEPVQCSDTNPIKNFCIHDQGDFDDYFKDVSLDNCENLETIRGDNGLLVGNPDAGNGGCGDGNFTTFVRDFSGRYDQKIKGFGAATTVMAMFILVNFLLILALLWVGREAYLFGPSINRPSRNTPPTAQEARAPDLVYGEPANAAPVNAA